MHKDYDSSQSAFTSTSNGKIAEKHTRDYNTNSTIAKKEQWTQQRYIFHKIRPATGQTSHTTTNRTTKDARINANLGIVTHFYKNLILQAHTNNSIGIIASTKLREGTNGSRLVKGAVTSLQNIMAPEDAKKSDHIPAFIIFEIAHIMAELALGQDLHAISSSFSMLRLYRSLYPQTAPIINSAIASYCANQPLLMDRLEANDNNMYSNTPITFLPSINYTIYAHGQSLLKDILHLSQSMLQESLLLGQNILKHRGGAAGVARNMLELSAHLTQQTQHLKYFSKESMLHLSKPIIEYGKKLLAELEVVEKMGTPEQIQIKRQQISDQIKIFAAQCKLQFTNERVAKGMHTIREYIGDVDFARYGDAIIRAIHSYQLSKIIDLDLCPSIDELKKMQMRNPGMSLNGNNHVRANTFRYSIKGYGPCALEI